VTDIEDVINSVVFGRKPSMPAGRHVERMDDDVFHLDYGDSDRVFRVTVEQVARTALSFERPLFISIAGQVRAELMKVAVANHIEVDIDAEPGLARQAAIAAFNIGMEQWASRADPRSAPPPWPAEEFATIQVQVSDDVSTRYSLCSGEHGGDGTEFLVRWRFRPTPPSTATRLTLSFVPPYGPSVRLDLYLDA
jgi:hypothetical protein